MSEVRLTRCAYCHCEVTDSEKHARYCPINLVICDDPQSKTFQEALQSQLKEAQEKIAELDYRREAVVVLSEEKITKLETQLKIAVEALEAIATYKITEATCSGVDQEAGVINFTVGPEVELYDERAELAREALEKLK